MHELEIFWFYADLPPLVMQFMELEPDDRSMRYRAQFSCGHAGML
jgi:predicted double-glycine peptidase